MSDVTVSQSETSESKSVDSDRPMAPKTLPLRVLDTDGRRMMPVAGSGGYLIQLKDIPSNPATWSGSHRRVGKVMLSRDFDRLSPDQKPLIRVKTRGVGGKGSLKHDAARITIRNGPYRPPLPGPRFTERGSTLLRSPLGRAICGSSAPESLRTGVGQFLPT
jgi:hypothetical protein